MEARSFFVVSAVVLLLSPTVSAYSCSYECTWGGYTNPTCANQCNVSGGICDPDLFLCESHLLLHLSCAGVSIAFI